MSIISVARQRSFRRGNAVAVARACLAPVLALALVPGAGAWDPDDSIIAQPCQWSPVVRVGGVCTGAYVGNRVVITAAHCLFESDNDNPPQPTRSLLTGLSIKFGEDDVLFEFEVDVASCAEYPGGAPFVLPNGSIGYVGPDVAYCVLEDEPEAVQGGVPVTVIPPMVPNGCARDWLSRQVRGVAPARPIAMAMGMGCEGSCGPSGTKRFTAVELYQFDSQKRFLVRRFEQEVGVRGGDSGGPIFVKLPDHTWRLIGVTTASAESFDVETEAHSVPPYLAWIESDSCIDITPCHARTPGTSNYFFTGCENGLPLDPGSAQAEWGNGCQVMLGGPGADADDECEEWPIGPADAFLAASP